MFPSFKFEVKRDGLEHVSKKLYLVQNVGNVLPFLPQFTESEKLWLCSQIKYQTS
jgi:hypothetical protein